MKTSNEINPKEFLTHAVQISLTIQEHAAALQLSSQNALSRYEEAIGDLQENQETEQSFLLPDWDPGLRSSKLSDNQKRYLIKKVHINQLLLSFHKRTAYQFLNSGNSLPIGIRNFHTLNIAYAKTLRTALSVLYSGKVARILLGLKPEFQRGTR